MTVSDTVTRLIAETDAELIRHLQVNHKPPVPATFAASARAAIVFAEDGDWTHQITLPNGRVMDARAIVNGLHLAAFITYP